MRSGVLCFYRIGICIFLKRDSGLRRTSEEIFFLYTSNPSPKKLPYLRCLPYITNVTPRNTTGHNRRRLISASVSFSASIFSIPSPYGHSPYLICDEQGERIKSAAPNLIPSGALWVSPFSPMLLRNIGETQKKQSFLRKGIRGMKRQSPPISY